MNCPICKNAPLSADWPEPELETQQCAQCGGRWLSSEAYWRWREPRGPQSLPERAVGEVATFLVEEARQGKLCPECGAILLPYKVGHDTGFSLDRCGHCGGVWLERNEWETLQSRNLHDDIHLFFAAPWQAQVFQEERHAAREVLLLEKFGESDLAEARRIKAWIDGHPRRDELLAFLTYGETADR